MNEIQFQKLEFSKYSARKCKKQELKSYVVKDRVYNACMQMV